MCLAGKTHASASNTLEGELSEGGITGVGSPHRRKGYDAGKRMRDSVTRGKGRVTEGRKKRDWVSRIDRFWREKKGEGGSPVLARMRNTLQKG